MVDETGVPAVERAEAGPTRTRSPTAASHEASGVVHSGERLSTESGRLSTESGPPEPNEGRGMLIARRPVAGGMIEAGAVTLRPLMYRSRMFGPPPQLHSLGVDELAHGGDLPPQLVVGGRLPGDLVAGMEDGGMVATAELRADAEQ